MKLDQEDIEAIAEAVYRRIQPKESESNLNQRLRAAKTTKEKIDIIKDHNRKMADTPKGKE